MRPKKRPVGRPPLGVGKARGERLTIRLTASERGQVDAMAGEAGASEWVRALILRALGVRRVKSGAPGE